MFYFFSVIFFVCLNYSWLSLSPIFIMHYFFHFHQFYSRVLWIFQSSLFNSALGSPIFASILNFLLFRCFTPVLFLLRILSIERDASVISRVRTTDAFLCFICFLFVFTFGAYRVGLAGDGGCCRDSLQPSWREGGKGKRGPPQEVDFGNQCREELRQRASQEGRERGSPCVFCFASWVPRRSPPPQLAHQQARWAERLPATRQRACSKQWKRQC